MTHEFLKWLATRWGADSASGNLHWDRLSRKITRQLTEEQALAWGMMLVGLVAERWDQLNPPGLATAKAAVAFLKIEETEHERWWHMAGIGASDIEKYLCSTLDEILELEEASATERADATHPLDDSHAEHDYDDCAACRQQRDFVTSCKDEIAAAIVTLVIQAYEHAVATSDAPAART